MTRILFIVTGSFDMVGGIHAFNRAFLKALDDMAVEEDFEIKILSLLDGDLSSESRARYLLSGRTRFTGYRGSRVKFSIDAIAQSFFADEIVIGHIDLAPLALGMGPAHKTIIVHGVDVWKRLPRLVKLGAARVSTVLGVSDYTLNSMAQFNGIAPAQAHVFPNTLDPYYPESAERVVSREKLGLPSGRMMLSVTRLQIPDRYKHIDLVIESLPAILKEAPDTIYVVVGDGQDRPRLQQVAIDHRVSQNVIFAGYVSDELLASYYASCDLFVLPSTKEGFGIVFLEAMYHRKGCIGAAAGGIPEVILDGETGLLAHTDRDGDFAHCAIELLKNDELRNKMGEAGRLRVTEQFSFDNFRGRLRLIMTGHESRPQEIATCGAH